MNRILLLCLIGCVQLGYAQDLLSMLENDDDEVQIVTSVFKDSRIIILNLANKLLKENLSF